MTENSNIPLVSVIMPVYNGSQYLAEAIQSVLKQSWNNWELLIINDGSTDATDDIIKSFTDARIRTFYQENSGVSKARNVGLDNAKGEFVAFLDSDDSYPEESIKNRIEVFQADNALTFVDGNVDCYDERMNSHIKSWSPGIKANPLNDLILLEGKSFFGPSWMIKSEIIGKTRFKDGLTHGEDLLFYIELAAKGGSYDYCSDTVLNYRTGNTSAMRNLKGLERGYKIIGIELDKITGISSDIVQIFRKKLEGLCLSHI